MGYFPALTQLVLQETWRQLAGKIVRLVARKNLPVFQGGYVVKWMGFV